jgi:hypothetical protein
MRIEAPDFAAAMHRTKKQGFYATNVRVGSGMHHHAPRALFALSGVRACKGRPFVAKRSQVIECTWRFDLFPPREIGSLLRFWLVTLSIRRPRDSSTFDDPTLS